MTTQAKHTQGPWTMERNGELPDRPYTVGKLFYIVADVGNEADARLIAAAPQLLEALQAITARFAQVMDDHTDLHSVHDSSEGSHEWTEGDAILRDTARAAIQAATKV